MSLNVSVAIATFNGEKYLVEQLQSIEEQIYPPYEVVICDDCSTDRTLELAKKFARKSRLKIRIHRNKKNIGFSQNFLNCSSACKGDWIAFCDQDDIWLPDKLKRVVSEINEDRTNELVLVCHSAILSDMQLVPFGHRIPDYRKYKRYAKLEQYGFICIPGFTITFNSKLLNNINSGVRPDDYFSLNGEPLSHDKWIPLLANVEGHTVYLPDSLAIYRRHPEALSGNYLRQSLAQRIKKARTVGTTFYKAQSLAAYECAESLSCIASTIHDDMRCLHFLNGAKSYRKLSKIMQLRSEVYSAGLAHRIACLAKILFLKGYWGDRFVSQGSLAFIKDLFNLFLRKNVDERMD